jgi:hypothetical protein
MAGFSKKSKMFLITRARLLIITGTIFLALMSSLCGCGSKIDISEGSAIIVVDKDDDIFTGFSKNSLILKTDKMIFTDKDNFLNKIFSTKTDSFSKIFEKAFDISEKVKNKNNIELKNYYISSKELTLVKAIFSDIKNRFEVIETSYDVKEEMEDNVCNKMIGKIAYLKNDEARKDRTMEVENQYSLSLFAALFSKKQEDNRKEYNPEGHVVLELSRIWPFKTSADNP